MKIWIDADACPRPVKDLVFRASDRLKIKVTLVSDRPVKRHASPLVSTVVVPKDMDSADKHIVQKLNSGDLVITADIPLAAEAVAKGAWAMDPRGDLYDEQNVRERLSMRDFFMSLREAGEELNGPAPFSKKDAARFANSLDRLLTRALKNADR